MNFNYDFIEIILLAVALVYSIVSHELAHGFVAYLLGDDTAKRRGRLSLNPLKHIDPFGLLSMLIFKFGWAKPVPVNFNNLKYKKVGTFLVSIAGILVNLFSAFIAILFIVFFPYQVIFNDYLNFFLSMIISYGISLAVFNLLPIPPLDGSKIIASFLPDKFRFFLFGIEKYGFLILMVLLFFNILDKPINILFDFIYSILLKLAGIFV